MASLAFPILTLSPIRIAGGAPADNGFALDAATDQLANMFSVQVTENIARIGFQCVLTGTSPTYKVSLQNLATGAGREPTGTILGGGSPNSATFTATNGWNFVTLDNVYAATAGDLLAMVFEHDSGTINGSNFISIRSTVSASAFSNNFPKNKRSTDSGVTWSQLTDDFATVMYGDTGTVRGVPMTDAAQINITLGTNGHRGCNKFTLPAGAGDTFKPAGIEFMGLQAGTGTDSLKYGIWNAAGTEQCSVTVVQNQIEAGSDKAIIVYFTTKPTLNFGTAYYLGVERVDGSTFINTWDVNASGDMEAFPLGTACHYSQWDGSSWTDTLTRRTFCNLILDDITQPAAGGGGARLLLIGQS